MMIFRSLEEVPRDFGPSAVTIGKFDGVIAKAFCPRIRTERLPPVAMR